jgi:glutamate dehydrogenase (NADP+)
MSKRYPWEKEFLQAVREVLGSLDIAVERDPKYRKAAILERLIEPERVIIFRVPWQDDRGDYHVNRAYRVEFNSAIGPYKGGIRFHPSVNLSILKFLGFEQTFTDVPAGDIGVGGREIGYMFGQYKRLRNLFEGVFTGKGLNWGGSLIRPEATGYGNVYFAQEMLKTKDTDFKGKRVAVSGSGNVAQYTVQKLNQLGAKVVTLSDSNGTIVDEDGVDEEKWNFVMELKNFRRGRIKEYAEKFNKAKYVEGKRPWGLTETEIALPSATQNELDLEDARALVEKGCRLHDRSGAGVEPNCLSRRPTANSRELFETKGTVFMKLKGCPRKLVGNSVFFYVFAQLPVKA